jgi:YD repeat-containing protein
MELAHRCDVRPPARTRVFDPYGRLVRYSLGNVVRDLTYDAADRISAYTHYTLAGAAQPVLDQSFGYDELGRLTTITTATASWTIGYDASGTRTYDLRQRLKTVQVGSRLSSYDYEPFGALKRLTRPDGSWIEYEYDDAQRQTAVRDHKGNRIDYMLDNAGNRTGESVKDPGGALRRTLTRTVDALNRIDSITGRN